MVCHHGRRSLATNSLGHPGPTGPLMRGSTKMHDRQFAPRACAFCGTEYVIAGPTVRWCSFACRFWSKVDKSGGPDACWPWMGGCYKTGYGQITGSLVPDGPRLHLYAHRLCLELTGTVIPPGFYACHECDVPACCNPHPKHVYVGTPSDNVTDMYERGRQGERNYATGERHGLVKRRLQRLENNRRLTS